MRSKKVRCTLCVFLFFIISGCQIAFPLPLNSWSKTTKSPLNNQGKAWRNDKILTCSRNKFRIQRFGAHRIARSMGTSKDTGGHAARRNLFNILGAVVIGFPPLLELYSRIGTQDSEFTFDLIEPLTKNSIDWDDVEHATLVFHGSGGQDKYTDKLMAKLKRMTGKATYSSMVEWSKYSTNIFQASYNGQRVGRIAATQLLERAKNLKSVHLIGISVGAFAANSACLTIKESRKDASFVQLTLLDPFTQRGIFDLGYGARMYGNEADYFQQYLNTDDPVPSTNAPLKNSVCYDITDIRPDEVSFGHDWPVAYYADQDKVGIVPPESRLERGTIMKIEK